MADSDAPAPIARRPKIDIGGPAERSLRVAILLLGARQLVDIWLSVLTLAGIFVLMLVLVAASLSNRYHWPPELYTIIATIGLLVTFCGLVGSGLLWLWADRRIRADDG